MSADFPAVLDAARRGEEWAWSHIYRDLSPRVLGYLRARGVPDPEDVAGEAFLQVVRDIARFSGDERAFRAWVFTIAQHRLLDAARYRNRRDRATPAEDFELELAAPHGDAEDEAVRNLVDGEIREVLETLSPDQQSVLLLRVFGGLTLPEIADIVGKRTGAVKALQRRGLAALARALVEKGSVPAPDGAMHSETPATADGGR